MNDRIYRIVQRRAELVDKIAAQRDDIAIAFKPIRSTFTLADKGLSGLRYLARHPVLLASSVAIAVAVLPKRWMFVLQGGWAAWRMALAAKRNLENMED
ncbi:MAG: hypothetical protein B7Y56_11285 [Gallionellales bacterium 35-53-114]|jgi:hypothetical protein|nr:MAG: hypothetical protein B7Y56_11285 [Gallionellales bacterium 35-53-114]OYZ64803.1 MAG: hypothetical protein B7Y04_03315 [Gallionellales bacterium 24-53-125]OZB07658.1 MAG: hypothetical protein B7X61_13700 [Gallionellales bacterium 39-52-133]HQS58649.1 YqjK-like family protein [Gallionellaceae bacterium]HQS74990.1 YqjK-like family protein [Gallionellaceae bacterium]